MKKSFALFLLSTLGFCLSPLTTNAQRDLLDGLLDREEPVFYVNLLPAEEDGVVILAIHFTHSKINTLEASFWIKDHGANLLGEGSKRLVRGLQTISNRQQDTIEIRGLSDRHFYSIGADYRNASSINRKFNTKVVQEGYFYTFPRKDKLADSSPTPAQMAPAPPAPMPEPALPQASADDRPATGPCHIPDLFVKVEPAGYCGAENRPAVSIQCDNCVGRDWEFSVEIRKEHGNWEPIRRDGNRQPAAGLGIRTEPLCLLLPGRYYLQVLAWGEHCETPVVYNLGPAITIAGDESAAAAAAPKTGAQPLAAVPDTCSVLSEAQLQGDVIRGALLLKADSPCAAWNPVASISYINPGHRNIDLEAMPLFPGQLTLFAIQLDQRDLARGIHTIQVRVEGHAAELPQPIPLYSFWLRATEGKGGELALANYRPENPAPYGQGWQKDPAPGSLTAAKGVEAPAASPYDDEDPLLEDSFQEVQVKATDPNCPQIQNLQLVYSPTQPDRPLYISWLSPRCCQEEGCEYSVWAGKTPGQLQLLVKGRKPGASVTEILQGLEAGDQYFEVVVRTPNGNRKAAYIPGEGPKYGIEAILDYQDRFRPQYSDPIVGIKGPMEETTASNPAVGGDLAGRAAAPAASAAPAAPLYEQPELPISKFEPCRIFRETHIIGNKPIRAGEKVMIEYAFHDKNYRYTLYHLPENGSEWVLAPGTKELQASPAFQFTAQPYHSGKYVILTCRPDGSWGCLSGPIGDALELKVMP